MGRFALGIRGKILAGLALPVLVALLTAGILSLQVTESAARAERVGALAASGARLSDLTQSLRAERSLSVLPSSAAAPDARERLREARDRTDRLWVTFRGEIRSGQVASLSPQAREALSGLAEHHRRLPGVRMGTDTGQVTPDVVQAFYTQVLVSHVELPRRIATSLPDRQQAYSLIAYSEARDRERGHRAAYR